MTDRVTRVLMLFEFATFGADLFAADEKRYIASVHQQKGGVRAACGHLHAFTVDGACLVCAHNNKPKEG